jgi:hypothetical protein
MSDETSLRAAVIRLEDSWLQQAYEISRLKTRVEGLEHVVSAAKEAVESLPCRCHPAYRGRGMQDPKCPCVELEPIRKALAGLNESPATV